MSESLINLPAYVDDAEFYCTSFAALITVETVLNSANPSIYILKELLKRVRFLVRRGGSNRNGLFSISRLGNSALSRHRSEESLRNEVRDKPQDFCFHVGAMRSYHPVHLAEMISILLAVCLLNGEDLRVQPSITKAPGELKFKVPDQN